MSRIPLFEELLMSRIPLFEELIMSRIPLFEEFLEETLPDLSADEMRGAGVQRKWSYTTRADGTGSYFISDSRGHYSSSLHMRDLLYLSGLQWWPDARPWEKRPGQLFDNVEGLLTVEQLPKVLDYRNIMLHSIYYEYVRWRLKRGV